MKKIITAIVIIITFVIVSVISYIGVGFYSVSGSKSAPPLVRDDFYFHKTGESREYTFRPKLFKDYNVAIESNPPFPVKEKFNWLVKYQLYRDKSLVKEGYLEERTRTFEKAMVTVKSLDFASFGILRFWPGTSTLRLTVEKGDPAAEKYLHEFKIAVGISWYM